MGKEIERKFLINENLLPKNIHGEKYIQTYIAITEQGIVSLSEIPDIKYLPYMSWREWINECGKYKVGIHMMRTHAAGTFSMNLAYHGTPCLGYSGLDTQDLLHPQTTVELGDIQGAQRILKKLYDDEFFYQECSEQTKGLFNAVSDTAGQYTRKFNRDCDYRLRSCRPSCRAAITRSWP